MKIAQVVARYPPYRGGMSQIAGEYTKQLRQRGQSVEAFTPRYGGPSIDDPSYVHRLPSWAHIGNAAVTPGLYRSLKEFDVVHLHYPFFGGAESALARALVSRRQAVVLSFYMDAAADGFRGAIFRSYRRVIFPAIAARADCILVSSLDYAKTSSLARVRNVFERVEVHPFGVDLERFHPGEEPELRASLGIGEDVPALLFVGGLDRAHHFKGLAVLFEALRQLDRLPWRLIVVGDGEIRTEYESLASSCGIGSRVLFAGDVSDADLPRYYRLASVHVLPSTGRVEAFGLVTLEAAASGVPSIVSDLPGVRTVVRHGETGLHVRAGDASSLRDALLTMLERQELRGQFGRAARLHAETNFSWPPLIDRLEQTYERVIADRRRRFR